MAPTAVEPVGMAGPGKARVTVSWPAPKDGPPKEYYVLSVGAASFRSVFPGLPAFVKITGPRRNVFSLELVCKTP